MHPSPILRFLGKPLDPDTASRLSLMLPLVLVAMGTTIALVRWFRMRRKPPQDPEAILLGAVASSLQERGQLAAVLGELRTVHEKLLDALPFGLLWVDQKQKVSAINALGLRMLGVTRGVVGLDAAFVLEPYPWLLEALVRAPGEIWRCAGSGRRWRLHRIEAPDRIGALLSFEDVTEIEAEERRAQLRDRFAELGEMTAGVAHQLKNGLAVLQGHGQLLQRQGHEEAAEALLQETGELNRVLQRFLQWAKPLEPRLESLHLEEVAGQAIAEVQRRPVAQGRRLELEGQGSAPADPMLLQQALVNLLENACQATPAGGRILVKAEDLGLEILDEGPGFGGESVAKMMRPFESGRPDGTGLGLPLALKWLNAQGADLRFEPRPQGGTKALIRW